MICGRRFSFITIASIDFWSDLQLIFLHFNACILPSIIRHAVVYAVWYGVWFLMVWPWFGHSSLNHNEYAVSSAVSRMKMPPVREHASSLFSWLGVCFYLPAFVTFSHLCYIKLVDNIRTWCVTPPSLHIGIRQTLKLTEDSKNLRIGLGTELGI